MALAPTITGTIAKYAYGSTDNYANIFYLIHFTENETDPTAYYYVEKQKQPSDDWEEVGFVLAGVGLTQVLIGHINSSDFVYTTDYLKVRITCYVYPDDLAPTSATYTIPAYSYSHALITSPSFVHLTSGPPYEEEFNFRWADGSFGVAAGIIRVIKASNNKEIPFVNSYVPVLLTDPGTLGNGFGFAQGRAFFRLTAQDPPRYGYSPEDYWVKDGDLINVELTTNVVPSRFAGVTHLNVPLVNVKSFIFYRLYSAVGETLSLNQSQFYTHQLSYTPNDSLTLGPITFARDTNGPAMPAGLSLSSAGVLDGTPTTIGAYSIWVRCFNKVGATTEGIEVVYINVLAPAVPVITAPTSPVALQTKTFASIQLVASNNPSSFAISSGTLPPGMGLNLTTGEISGTPTTVAAPVVVFTATNLAGTSATYSITFNVTALPVPSITSALTDTAYINENFAYTITSTPTGTSWGTVGLPSGLSLAGPIISGSVAIPGVYDITIRATNAAGSDTKTLRLTVSVRIPVITSPLTATGALGVPFSYQIGASNNPTSYGATNLPPGLAVNRNTGLISGTPSSGGLTNVTISATNAGGTITATLAITIALPEKPVIDTTITSGKTVTALTGVTFAFQPTASNDPTLWTAYPVPANMALIPATGEVIGQFAIPGLYGLIMTASNIGGTSDPATFFFLVESGSSAVVAAADSYGVDLWIDVQDGSVLLTPPGQTLTTTTTAPDGSTTTTEAPAAATGAILSVKRGDTLPITIRFHKSGIPVNITPSSIKLAVREDFDQPYIILADTFTALPNSIGAFAILPDYSENAQLNFDLEGEKDEVEYMTEVQWETAAPDPVSRRSCDTFTSLIKKDVINPDA